MQDRQFIEFGTGKLDPLDEFPIGVKYHGAGYANGMTALSGNSGRQWAATVGGHVLRDSSGLPYSFETADQALVYARERVLGETVRGTADLWVNGSVHTLPALIGPSLGLDPTAETWFNVVTAPGLNVQLRRSTEFVRDAES